MMIYELRIKNIQNNDRKNSVFVCNPNEKDEKFLGEYHRLIWTNCAIR